MRDLIIALETSISGRQLLPTDRVRNTHSACNPLNPSSAFLKPHHEPDLKGGTMVNENLLTDIAAERLFLTRLNPKSFFNPEAEHSKNKLPQYPNPVADLCISSIEPMDYHKARAKSLISTAHADASLQTLSHRH
jgi:hypothetical protein